MNQGTKEDLRKSLFTSVAKSTTENARPSSMVIKVRAKFDVLSK